MKQIFENKFNPNIDDKERKVISENLMIVIYNISIIFTEMKNGMKDFILSNKKSTWLHNFIKKDIDWFLDSKIKFTDEQKKEIEETSSKHKLELLKKFKEEIKPLVDIQDENEDTVLHLTIKSNNSEYIKILLNILNIKINKKNNLNFSPFALSLTMNSKYNDNQFKIQELLIKYPKLKFTDEDLLIAVNHDVNLDIIKKMLPKLKIVSKSLEKATQLQNANPNDEYYNEQFDLITRRNDEIKSLNSADSNQYAESFEINNNNTKFSKRKKTSTSTTPEKASPSVETDCKKNKNLKLTHNNHSKKVKNNSSELQGNFSQVSESLKLMEKSEKESKKTEQQQKEKLSNIEEIKLMLKESNNLKCLKESIIQKFDFCVYWVEDKNITDDSKKTHPYIILKYNSKPLLLIYGTSQSKSVDGLVEEDFIILNLNINNKLTHFDLQTKAYQYCPKRFKIVSKIKLIEPIKLFDLEKIVGKLSKDQLEMFEKLLTPKNSPKLEDLKFSEETATSINNSTEITNVEHVKKVETSLIA